MQTRLAARGDKFVADCGSEQDRIFFDGDGTFLQRQRWRHSPVALDFRKGQAEGECQRHNAVDTKETDVTNLSPSCSASLMQEFINRNAAATQRTQERG